MWNSKRLFALGAASTLSLFSLIGCGATPEAAAPANSGATIQASASDKSGFAEMSAQISEAKTAIEAGNADAAKTAMDKVENSWKTVEDGLKKTDKATYDAIETHMDEANGALKGASPNAAVVSEHLKMLEKTVASVLQ